MCGVCVASCADCLACGRTRALAIASLFPCAAYRGAVAGALGDISWRVMEFRAQAVGMRRGRAMVARMPAKVGVTCDDHDLVRA